MSLNHLHSNLSRFEGCTITGTLAVSAFVSDAVSIVHGPAGCAHHNVSLLNTTLLQQDTLPRPNILSTNLGENDVIFGGEEVLEDTIHRAVERSPGAVFVISTCITDTIGDDVEAVCAKEWGVPVLHLRSAGFLGGSFHEGFSRALIAISTLIPPSERRDGGINLIGEKNLEFEVEDNFREIKRLLAALDLPVNVRFVRNVSMQDLPEFACGSLNIVREDPDGTLSDYFYRTFGIPAIRGFPVGLSQTLRFIEDVGAACGVESSVAVADEAMRQEELADEFADLMGEQITFDSFGFQCPEFELLREVAELVGIRISPEGSVIPIPFGMPVGTSGIRTMLRQWRRFIHA